MQHEELAIIEGGKYGCRDAGRPILWFGIKMLNGGSLICLEMKEANEFIQRENINDVAQLNGKACVVFVEGNSVTFARLHK